jgi:hypothetical protein
MKRILCLLLAGACILCAPADSPDVDSNIISLAGGWQFRLDPDGVGEGQNWQTQALTEKVILPGSTDENKIGTAYDGAILAPTTSGFREIMSPTLSWLTRHYEYEGPAWYQRDIEIPADWDGRNVTLFLERCHWESTVWIDDQRIGSDNSLSTPHVYDLSAALSPGTHRLTIRVDNTLKLDVGLNAHSVSFHTQTNWNGIIGRMELQAADPVQLTDVQVYPNVDSRMVRVTATVQNTAATVASGLLRIAIAPAGESRVLVTEATAVSLAPGESVVGIETPMSADIQLWDEFTPHLYDLQATLEAGDSRDSETVNFGVRDFTHNGTQFQINKRTTHLRGTLECSIFPLTGYPSMDVDAWLRIFRVMQSYGLNHMRFHSWCPPEAAFVAADQLGVILQPEAPVWAHDLGREPERDAFMACETRRILDTYGNHPSFCMFSLGNELGGEIEFLRNLVVESKQHDSRRLYTTTSSGGFPMRGGEPQPCDDFMLTNTHNGLVMRGDLRGESRFYTEPPETVTDYRAGLEGLSIPFVVHEVGQWVVYPNFKEIEKYTGVLRPRNFEIFRDSLNAHHMGDQAEDFLKSSGALSALLYKEEIESNLRTPGIGGFQLLDMRDFPGQGSALVGILDPFWDSKGIVSGEQHREYCNDVVPLARMTKRIWTTNETFTAGAEVAHYGASDIENATVRWSVVTRRGEQVQAGTFPAKTIKQGGLTPVGDISLNLAELNNAAQLSLQLSIDGTDYRNRWNFWVYPAKQPVVAGDDILVSRALNADTRRALDDGRKVLLLPQLEPLQQALPGSFTPVFWSPIWFPREGAALTMGILCNPEHPALANFPTAFHSDWQWWDITLQSKALQLDAAPPEFRPIVQIVDHYNRNHRLGSLFEARIGEGRLMVSAFDLETNIQNRPEARQLRTSVLQYMQSDAFNPAQKLDWPVLEWILR